MVSFVTVFFYNYKDVIPQKVDGNDRKYDGYNRNKVKVKTITLIVTTSTRKTKNTTIMTLLAIKVTVTITITIMITKTRIYKEDLKSISTYNIT